MNDRPMIVLAESVLKVGAGGTLSLPPSLFTIEDPDTRADQIIVVVSYNDSRLIIPLYTFQHSHYHFNKKNPLPSLLGII